MNILPNCYIQPLLFYHSEKEYGTLKTTCMNFEYTRDEHQLYNLHEKDYYFPFRLNLPLNRDVYDECIEFYQFNKHMTFLNSNEEIYSHKMNITKHFMKELMSEKKANGFIIYENMTSRLIYKEPIDVKPDKGYCYFNIEFTENKSFIDKDFKYANNYTVIINNKTSTVYSINNSYIDMKMVNDKTSIAPFLCNENTSCNVYYIDGEKLYFGNHLINSIIYNESANKTIIFKKDFTIQKEYLNGYYNTSEYVFIIICCVILMIHSLLGLIATFIDFYYKKPVWFMNENDNIEGSFDKISCFIRIMIKIHYSFKLFHYFVWTLIILNFCWILLKAFLVCCCPAPDKT